MKIKTKIILGFLVLLVPIVIIGGFSYWGLSVIRQDIRENISGNINNLSIATNLNSLAQFIRYYDEVLTQSARNYAFTGHDQWKKRYEESAPLLDNYIKDAIKLGDGKDKEYFSNIDAANIALAKMEEQAMGLTSQGQQQKAIDILEGKEYAKQKKIYQDGLVAYVQQQGKEYDDILSVSTQAILESIKRVESAINVGARETVISFAATCLFSIIFGLITAWQILRPISRISKTAREIADGNINARVEVKSKDELGDLSKSFNEMTDKLQKTQENIEEKVRERTIELEKTNKFMTGRELRMIELKKKIAELEKKK